MQVDNFLKGVTVFANLEPQWNETMGCYTLNFYDRVKLASKKNYQMIRPGDKNTIFFQFGKVLQKTQNCCPHMVFAHSYLHCTGDKRGFRVGFHRTVFASYSVSHCPFIV
jgi:hypothetical protein